MGINSSITASRVGQEFQAVFNDTKDAVYTLDDKIRMALGKPMKASSVNELVTKFQFYEHSPINFKIQGTMIVNDYSRSLLTGHRPKMEVGAYCHCSEKPIVKFNYEGNFVFGQMSMSAESGIENHYELTYSKTLRPMMMDAVKTIRRRGMKNIEVDYIVEKKVEL